MAHVLVAGLGDLGEGVARHWLGAGHRVSAIRRRQQAPDGVDLYAQDLNGPTVLLPPDPVELLYIILTPEERSEQGYTRAFLEAPLKLLDRLAEQQPLPPVIFVSSTAVYGEADKVDEQTPPRPERFNGRILLAAEEEISTRALATVVRFSGIYGPGRERLLRQAAEVADGAAPPALRWTNRIHRDDCVRLLVHLGEGWLAGDLQPSVVLGTDREPVLNRDVLNWLGERTGRPLDLSTAGEPGGKRVFSRYLQYADDFHLDYPDFRAGYEQVLAAGQAQ